MPSVTYFEYEGGIKDTTPRTVSLRSLEEPPCGCQEPDCDQHDDDGPSFVKRRRFETQRAKPWHIGRPGSEVAAEVLCGAYKNYADNWNTLCLGHTYADRFSEGHVVVNRIPEGQIVCSRCEKLTQ